MALSVDRINGISGDLAIKAPCRVATTANITLAGFQTLDGVALADGDPNLRVLVKNQTDNTQNGIYNAASGAWLRSTDFNGAYDVVKGTELTVQEGTVNGGFFFVVATSDPIVIGTSALAFTSSTTAANSAIAAAASATAAQTAETNAETAETNAELAEANAAASAAAAQTAETNAETAETNAAARAVAAQTAETNAETAETNAAASAAIAAAAAAAAAGGGGTRNRIANSGMSVDQRNSGGAVVVSAGGRNYCMDRWYAGASGGGQLTVQRVDVSGGDSQGSAYAASITATTVDAAIAAGDTYIFSQVIEGLTIHDLYLGTASAKRFSVSFRCSVTADLVGQTLSGAVVNAGGARSYPFTFVPASTAYTTYGISIPGLTDGGVVITTAEALSVRFDLGCGTTFRSTSQGAAVANGTTLSVGTWLAGNFIGVTGAHQMIGTLNSKITIKDVQLELGSVASVCEVEFPEATLRRCRRYFRGQAYYIPATVAQNLGTIDMRTVPAITGGGAGFTSTGTTADQLIAFQTTGAVATLSLNAEL